MMDDDCAFKNTNDTKNHFSFIFQKVLSLLQLAANESYTVYVKLFNRTGKIE